ncbi:MAG TPA: hypothetical protein VHK86_04025 [Nitrososphaera sp.]|jgi:hypothetical protein|nr:hypothetical protein [Nitrososphaera sp.]
MPETEQWLPMSIVAERLKISAYKLSRMAQKGAIVTKPDILDARVKLVELNEVKRIFRVEEK